MVEPEVFAGIAVYVVRARHDDGHVAAAIYSRDARPSGYAIVEPFDGTAIRKQLRNHVLVRSKDGSALRPMKCQCFANAGGCRFVAVRMCDDHCIATSDAVDALREAGRCGRSRVNRARERQGEER
jgi:hypothetical protein